MFRLQKVFSFLEGSGGASTGGSASVTKIFGKKVGESTGSRTNGSMLEDEDVDGDSSEKEEDESKKSDKSGDEMEEKSKEEKSEAESTSSDSS